MDFNRSEVEAVWAAAARDSGEKAAVFELTDIQLALVGGGIGTVILG